MTGALTARAALCTVLLHRHVRVEVVERTVRLCAVREAGDEVSAAASNAAQNVSRWRRTREARGHAESHARRAGTDARVSASAPDVLCANPEAQGPRRGHVQATPRQERRRHSLALVQPLDLEDREELQ